MQEVLGVAFWIGLISGIVSIVLSIVAIVFSILVDRRSSKISEHTIQSLQKIESAVERSSSDTRELIKAGWDKMLGGVDRAPLPTQGDAGAKEVAAGIAAELRSELASLNTAKPGGDTAEARIAGLESYLKNLEASLSAQLKAQQADPRPSVKFESVLEAIGDLTRPAQALLRGISRVHLTKSEYQHLSQGRLGPALVELRKVGLLVPVVHKTSHGPEPCYYFPPGISKIARAALHVLPEPAQEIQQDVTKELKAVGYPSGHGDDDRPVGANGTNTA